MSKPTPRPWSVSKHPSSGIMVEMPNGSPVCHMRWSDGLRADVEAQVAEDAAHIVKCVNAHEDLVEALRELIAETADIGGSLTHWMPAAQLLSRLEKK